MMQYLKNIAFFNVFISKTKIELNKIGNEFDFLSKFHVYVYIQIFIIKLTIYFSNN